MEELDNIEDNTEELNELLSISGISNKTTKKTFEYKIFEPTKKEMKVQYPELSEMEEFASMTDKDIRFVWYYACQSSDISKIPDKQSRMKMALKSAYGDDWFKFNTAQKIAAWEFPEYITIAINRMAKFSPEARGRGKAMIERLFDNYERIVDVDPELFETWSPSERKSFVQLGVEMSDALPKVIQQLERGFAVSSKKADGEKETQEDYSGLMDRVIGESDY